MANYSVSSMYNTSSDIIVVNGVRMSMADHRKQIKAKKHNIVKKHKKQPTEINLLPTEIKSMMRNVRLLKSLTAYYNNGYRQWGRIAKMVIEQKEIRSPFIKFISKQKEIEETINEIANISKKNDKSVFAFVRKLSYQLDDIRTHLQDLSNVEIEKIINKCQNISDKGVDY